MSLSVDYPTYILPGALTYRNGIWYTKNSDPVSYPEEGNELCYQLEENSFWFMHRNKCITKAVELYSPKELFFDIGGGNGFVAKALQNAGRQVVLIEPGKKGCVNAQKRGVQQIICGTFKSIQLKPSSIGACGFFDVIEHIENDLELLQSLYHFIKPGGIVYITVPAYNFLWSQEDIDAGHFRRYTLNSITDVLKKAGYNIIYNTYLFSFLPAPIFLSRTLPYKLKLSMKESNHKKDHTNKNVLSKLVDKLLAIEAARIKHQKKIPFGSSCFIVAQKEGLN